MPRSLKALPLTLALLTLALAALSLLFTSCGGSGNTAQARFINAISDTQAYGNAGLDIDINTTKQFTNIIFPVPPSSSYKSIPSGNDTVEGLETNSTTQVFSQNVGLIAGSQYTLIATGLDTGSNGSNVVILSPVDNNTAPANGSVNFRVINASVFGPTGDGNAVDVYILPTGTNATSCSPPNCISNLAYKSASAYVTLPYNSNGNGWQLTVTRSTGNPTPYFNFSIATFGGASEGAICTLVLTDQQNGSNMSSLPVQLNDLNGCNP
jgi:hypothetical protein